MNKFVLAIVFISSALLGGCSLQDGDWLGPLERGLRSAFGKWDMWDTPSVRPYENPMPPIPEGAIPVRGVVSYEKAAAEFERLSPKYVKERGKIAYRRYCHHCHGANGDGRIIVGESFDPRLPDLRLEATQSKTDEEMFYIIMEGSGEMIPLADTLTPVDLLSAISHIRSLKNAPSAPYFAPKNVRPLE